MKRVFSFSLFHVNDFTLHQLRNTYLYIFKLKQFLSLSSFIILKSGITLHRKSSVSSVKAGMKLKVTRGKLERLYAEQCSKKKGINASFTTMFVAVEMFRVYRLFILF